MHNNRVVILIIIIASSLLFIPFTGITHLFDWDEANFAEAAREMIATGDYLSVQINYLPFHEKPPLFIWMQALSMSIFGVNELAARFPNAICGILTLLVIYLTGTKTVDRRFGLIWVMCYAGSILPFFYFKSGIIDPWFNLFIFTGLYFYIRSITHQPHLHMLLSGLFIGLAVLTKGPVGFLIFFLTIMVHLIIQRFKGLPPFSSWLIFTATLIVTGCFWFVLQIAAGREQLMMDFIRYHLRLLRTGDAGHSGFPLYHPIVLYFGVFPSSLLALATLSRKTNTVFPAPGLRLWMIILLSVVLILFSIVKTKIVHYSSLCYFPITFLAAMFIWNYYKETRPISKRLSIMLIVTGTLIALAVFAVPLTARNSEILFRTGILRDSFAAENLKANIQWTGLEWLICLAFAGIIAYSAVSARNQKRHAFILLYAATICFTYLLMIIFVPRIEGITQRAAIEFYQKAGNEDRYLSTFGFKSYAFLFYSKKKPSPPHTADREWLLTGDIDKPAYFVTKITKKDVFLFRYSGITFLYDKNGYAFFVRYPVSQP